MPSEYSEPQLNSYTNITGTVVLAGDLVNDEIAPLLDDIKFIKSKTRLIRCSDASDPANIIFIFNWPTWGPVFKKDTGNALIDGIRDSGLNLVHPMEYTDGEIKQFFNYDDYVATDGTVYGPHDILKCVPLGKSVTFNIDTGKTFDSAYLKESDLKPSWYVGDQTGYRQAVSGNNYIYYNPVTSISYDGNTYTPTDGCSTWAKPGIKTTSMNCYFNPEGENFRPRVNLELQYVRDSAWINYGYMDNSGVPIQDIILQNQESSSNDDPFDNQGYCDIIMESSVDFVSSDFPMSPQMITSFDWGSACRTGQQGESFPSSEQHTLFSNHCFWWQDYFIKEFNMPIPDTIAVSGEDGYICTAADTGGNEPSNLFQVTRDLASITVQENTADKTAFIFYEGNGIETINAQYQSSDIQIAQLDRPALLKTISMKYKSIFPIQMAISFDDGSLWWHEFPGDFYAFISNRTKDETAIVGRRAKTCKVSVFSNTSKKFEIHKIELGY